MDTHQWTPDIAASTLDNTSKWRLKLLPLPFVRTSLSLLPKEKPKKSLPSTETGFYASIFSLPTPCFSLPINRNRLPSSLGTSPIGQSPR